MIDTVKTDEIIKHFLKTSADDLGSEFESNVFLLRSPITIGLDDAVRIEMESLSGQDFKKPKMTVILETPGGFIETAERIHKVFRHHFDVVEFIIPNFAYSAGTVLALSGDEIYMDYYSVLGPIDPQVENRDGKMVPGLGYLQKYKQLIQKSHDHQNGALSDAEVEFLIRKFDPAELFVLEQAIAHSKNLIEEWLPRYKFKNWKRKETTGELVTEEYKKQRANQIATILGNAERWNSHARGIFMKDLDSEEIKLKIRDLADNETVRGKVMQYYDLFVDYCGKIGCHNALHSRNGLVPLGG